MVFWAVCLWGVALLFGVVFEGCLSAFVCSVLYGFSGGGFYVFFCSSTIFYAGLLGVYVKRNGIIVN